MLTKLHKLLEKHYDEMVEIRRYLHQFPELSFKEFQTAAYIADYYKRLGIPYQTDVGGNGVVAKIKGARPGKTVALRADFDALPIQDEKEVEYKSKIPGVMHACGHDGHTATLLVLAKCINEWKEELEGTVVLIHQHAEEYAPGGAASMIQDGCLEGVDAIFGTHLWSSVPVGTIQYRVGPVMAAADRFAIKVQGSGGHGAQPHKTKDAIVTASQLVLNLQQIVSRRVNPIEPAVISVGTFVAENAFNVIADSARIEGTVRTFNEEVGNQIKAEIDSVAAATCALNGSSYEYTYAQGYPAVINHKEETEFLVELASSIQEINYVEETEPHMGGEDFAYYLRHTKGTFFFTGAKPEGVEEAYPHHHPKFDINEKALLIAAKTLGAATVLYNQRKSDRLIPSSQA